MKKLKTRKAEKTKKQLSTQKGIETKSWKKTMPGLITLEEALAEIKELRLFPEP